MPSAGMSGNSPQRRSDAVTFHVQTFLLEGCSYAAWEEAAAPLRHVLNSHAGGGGCSSIGGRRVFQEYLNVSKMYVRGGHNSIFGDGIHIDGVGWGRYN